MGKYAVCVGINDYPGTGNDLFGCVNDANDWEAELARRKFTVTKLLDKAASKRNIKTALTDAVTGAAAGDLVVFTYSGHGSWQPDDDGDEPDGRDEGWCPYDINTAGLLTDDEMYDIFSQAKTGVKIIMLSDSCHSGTVARMAPPPAEGAAINRIRFLPPDRFLKKAKLEVAEKIAGTTRATSKPHRALLISGCKDTEYSYDANFSNRPNGAFTYFALKSLKKLGAKGTYVDWHKAIRKSLPSPVHPQSPNLFGSSAQKKWKVFG